MYVIFSAHSAFSIYVADESKACNVVKCFASGTANYPVPVAMSRHVFLSAVLFIIRLSKI